MKTYDQFVTEVKQALSEIGVSDVIFDQDNTDGCITLDTGVYLLDNNKVTFDPKVGCRCHNCHSCEQAGRAAR